MLLLDTHALVWLASDREQLTPNGQAAIRGSAGRLFMSAISSLEIALLVKRHRLDLPLPPERFVAESLRHHGIAEIAVDSTIAMAAAALEQLARRAKRSGDRSGSGRARDPVLPAPAPGRA
jgi:PIN domain nuclease of toxin-antitoxin system